MPGKKKAICSICQKALAYSGGTSSLHKQLYSKHLLQYFLLAVTRKLVGVKCKCFVKPSKCMEACAKGLSAYVSQMITQDLRLIRMGECEGFWNLLAFYKMVW